MQQHLPSVLRGVHLSAIRCSESVDVLRIYPTSFIFISSRRRTVVSARGRVQDLVADGVWAVLRPPASPPPPPLVVPISQ